MANDKEEVPVMDVYTKEMVENLLRWLRNDTIANDMLNYHIVKEGGNVITEGEIIEEFIKNHHITSKKYPIGYSVLRNAEN